MSGALEREPGDVTGQELQNAGAVGSADQPRGGAPDVDPQLCRPARAAEHSSGSGPKPRLLSPSWVQPPAAARPPSLQPATSVSGRRCGEPSACQCQTRRLQKRSVPITALMSERHCPESVAARSAGMTTTRLSQFRGRRLPMLVGLALFPRVWGRTPVLGEIGRR